MRQDLRPYRRCRKAQCARRMRIGARIVLNMEIGAARGGMAGLADGGWLMSPAPGRDPYRGHPAGRARPAVPAPGGGTGVLAVMFGTLSSPAGRPAALPVRWELLEPGDACAVLLAGDIVLASLPGDACSTLTLGGTCWMLPAVRTDDGYEQARLQVIETARAFITRVAIVLAGSPDSVQQPPGPAWSWLTGQPQAP